MGKHVVMLVDGDCAMCNWCVRFIAERDTQGIVYFETQQSETGRKLLAKYKQPMDLSTVVVIDRHSDPGVVRCYTKSDAILLTFGKLGMPWAALSAFTFIPHLVRDGVYDCVAATRYRVFGRTTECVLPSSTARRQIKRAVPEF